MIVPERPDLRTALDSPETKRGYVRRLFSTIADRYDLITVLLSYGRDRTWKDRLVRMAGASRGIRALDVACGTGDIAFRLAADGARVIGMDITLRMLELASKKRSPANAPDAVRFLAGDMMALPFNDGAFDVVTTGYGIRNVPTIAPALAEIHRVLKPGGVFLSLDFNRPSNPWVRGVYLLYLTVAGSALGYLLHRDPDTYRYIPESIARYPGAHQVCAIARQQGFVQCAVVPVLGGLMAIHRAHRAARP
jgi:ubiquinone/menaquinone biosynthesis methyltransferase